MRGGERKRERGVAEPNRTVVVEAMRSEAREERERERPPKEEGLERERRQKKARLRSTRNGGRPDSGRIWARSVGATWAFQPSETDSSSYYMEQVHLSYLNFNVEFELHHKITIPYITCPLTCIFSTNTTLR